MTTANKETTSVAMKIHVCCLAVDLKQWTFQITGRAPCTVDRRIANSLRTQEHKHRTYYPSVAAIEDSARFRPRSNCYRALTRLTDGLFNEDISISDCTVASDWMTMNWKGCWKCCTSASYCVKQWYSTFFVRVPPDIISLQLRTPKVVGV
jgi:hypothetical protein